MIEGIIGAAIFGTFGALHIWNFRALFSEGRIPVKYIWGLLTLSIVWNVSLWIFLRWARPMEILIGFLIVLFLLFFVYRTIGEAYTKYLGVLSSFFIFTGKLPTFLVFCIATIFLFMLMEIVRFNTRILCSNGSFFPIAWKYLFERISLFRKNFSLSKVLQYGAIFSILLFCIRAIQTMLFSEIPRLSLREEFSFTMLVTILSATISWGTFRMGRNLFLHTKISGFFMIISFASITFWHLIEPNSFMLTAQLSMAWIFPLAAVLGIRKLFQFYAEIIETELVDYRELSIGDTVDMDYLFRVWYDYQVGNDRIMKTLQSLRNPIDLPSKNRISRFFQICLRESRKKQLNGFSPRFEVRILREISLLPILVPTFLSFFVLSLWM